MPLLSELLLQAASTGDDASGGGLDVTDLLVPVIAGVFALVGAWAGIFVARRKAIDGVLVKRRIAAFDAIMPDANDVYCYLVRVGDFRMLDPAKVLALKRRMDRAVMLNASLFSVELTTRYGAFSDACFAPYRGHGTTAGIRADRTKLERDWGSGWKTEWNASFVDPGEATDAGRLGDVYAELVDQFAVEIGARRRAKALRARAAVPAAKRTAAGTGAAAGAGVGAGGAAGGPPGPAPAE